MKKKLILPFMLCAFAVSMTGCGHEHVWTDATCLVPKTCSECGETEGEAAGHKWVEADCKSARHCEVCGETEGEPLSHEWADATYTEPKTCSLCGETEGEPLPEPYFSKNNITFEKLEDMDLPFAMDYTEGGEVANIDGLWMGDKVAHFTFGEITSEPSDEEGYIKVTIPYEVKMSTVLYNDSSLYSGNYSSSWSCSGFSVGDCYTGLVVPRKTITVNGEGAGEFHKDFEWDGDAYSISYTDDENSDHSFSGWKYESGTIYSNAYSRTLNAIITITIPEDYDGTVLYIERGGRTELSLGAEDDEIEDKDEYFLDEHDADYYIFYRLSDLISN